MMTTFATTAPAELAADFPHAAQATRPPAAPGKARRGAPSGEAVAIVKTTFHGQNPWAALHLLADGAAATEAAPRSGKKPASKAKIK